MKLGDLNISIVEDATYTHPALDITERDMFVIDASDTNLVFLGKLDLFLPSTMLVSATFRLYSSPDGGATWVQRYGAGPAGGSIAWTPSDGRLVQFLVNGVWDHPLKVTIQSGGVVGEAASRDIVYSYNGAR